MGPKVLALIENSIGVRLTLAARLTDVGYQVTVVTTPEEFRERIRGEVFDWIFLEDAAVPPPHHRFFAHLADHRRGARVVWCGKVPRKAPVSMEAVFAKPLKYDEIERFFSQWTTDGDVMRKARGAPQRILATDPKAPPHCAEAAQKHLAEAGTRAETAGGKGDRTTHRLRRPR